jgi:hypothetical protein
VGGFSLRSAKSEITASGTSFTGSGADAAGTPGSHRAEQTMFHCTSRTAGSNRCITRATPSRAPALSGTGKEVSHTGDVFLGCGQAIEDGYNAPTGTVERCFISGGRTGVRFGDNYDWSYGGTMRATNCIIIHNHRDVWGMNWQDWTYRASAMDIRSNLLSAPNPHHPANRLWDPTADGWRLAAFLSAPPDAAVGMGFAVWTNRYDMVSLFDGVPVGLSSFTTNFVGVDYAVVSGSGETLATGTLAFSPGETVKRVQPAGFDLSA